MSCNCKKKQIIPPQDQPRTIYKIRVTENGSIEEVLSLPPSPAATVKNIVDKMSEILTPSS